MSKKVEKVLEIEESKISGGSNDEMTDKRLNRIPPKLKYGGPKPELNHPVLMYGLIRPKLPKGRLDPQIQPPITNPKTDLGLSEKTDENGNDE